MDSYNVEFIKHLATWTIPVLYAITLHEAAHGWAAKKLGDNTAFMLGRVSSNPFKHIDPVGTVMIPIVLLFLGGFIFGWAKPVPVNDHSFKNPKRDMALVALAGPIANILMAIFWAYMIKLSFYLKSLGYDEYVILEAVGNAGIIINIVLAMFNLLPIPPLDGSKIIYSVISRRMYFFYSKLEPYGFLIIIAMIISGVLSEILGPMIKTCYMLIYNLVF
ncbi:MAG: site-2 protease family protein [Pseudomonadota bacterium]|nr:site-2 protease family protein [Pseudomonadota bacterium]